MKKRIEDPFQILASQIIDGTLTGIGSSGKVVVDRFLALLKTRAEYKYADCSPIGVKGLPGEKLTKEEEEEFEYKKTLFLREDATIPAHRLHPIPIQIRIDRYCYAFARIKWGIIQAQMGHFVVPDTPNHTIIPLTPTLCLCDTGGQTGVITSENLAEINRASRALSYEYFLLKTYHCVRRPLIFHTRSSATFTCRRHRATKAIRARLRPR
jgi:hypothetical protein